MVNRFEEVSTESDNEISKLTEETKTLRQTIESLECKIRELEERPSSEKLFQVRFFLYIPEIAFHMPDVIYDPSLAFI